MVSPLDATAGRPGETVASSRRCLEPAEGVRGDQVPLWGLFTRQRPDGFLFTWEPEKATVTRGNEGRSGCPWAGGEAAVAGSLPGRGSVWARGRKASSRCPLRRMPFSVNDAAPKFIPVRAPPSATTEDGEGWAAGREWGWGGHSEAGSGWGRR